MKIYFTTMTPSINLAKNVHSKAQKIYFNHSSLTFIRHNPSNVHTKIFYAINLNFLSHKKQHGKFQFKKSLHNNVDMKIKQKI